MAYSPGIRAKEYVNMRGRVVSRRTFGKPGTGGTSSAGLTRAMRENSVNVSCGPGLSARSGRQFVVCKTGRAYDVRTRGVNRKLRLEVFFANPFFADFGVRGGVGGGGSLLGAG